MAMITVFNARANKFAKAEKIDADTYTLIFEDGTQKEVKETTFKKWYKEVDASDIQKAPDTNATPAPTPEAEQLTTEEVTGEETSVNPDPTPEEIQAKEVEDKAKADADAQKKAEADAEKLANKAQAEADKLKKKADADAEKLKKKEAADKAKADKDAQTEADKVKKKADADAEKAKKKEDADKAKAEREAKKAEAEAKKAANANTPKVDAKERNKRFFTQFLEALNAKESGFSKAGARDRNYMSFPAGASGFKYKFVYNEGKLNCSLYIFGPKIVTTALFNALESHKAEIQAKMTGFTLDWNAPEELNTRRVITILNGSDAELIEKGVDTLINFRDVFNEYIEIITK